MAVLSYEQAKRLARLDSYKEIAFEYEKILNAGIQKYLDDFSECCADSQLNPVDEGYDKIEMLRLFKYRMALMIICCLCETWEQDLYNFLKEQGIIFSIMNEYEKIKNALKNSSIGICLDDYPKICEMRTFVNAIKHGNGNSYERLKQLLGDSILADSNLGYIAEDGSEHINKQIRYDENVLTSITINPNGKIKEYYDSIVDFWRDVFNELYNLRGNSQ